MTKIVRINRQNEFTWGWAVLIIYMLTIFISAILFARHAFQGMVVMFAVSLILLQALLYQGFEIIEK